MPVAILGCGPAGLLAAHAVVRAGDEPVIFSRKRKSELFGAQYLLAPVEGITIGDPITVTNIVRGTSDQYREKVYGYDAAERAFGGAPLQAPETHRAWDIRQTYDALWARYGRQVINTVIDDHTPGVLMKEGFLRIVSSVPAYLLCHDRDHGTHKFPFQEAYAIGEAPERGIFLPEELVPPEATVIRDGTEANDWYRISNVFGYATAEFPAKFCDDLPYAAGALVTKPVSNNCNCWPWVTRVGRFGAWDYRKLVHHSLPDTMKALLSE